MSDVKYVYICHKLGNNIEENSKKINDICRKIALEEPNTIPFAPYMHFIQFLNDKVSEERELGLTYNLAIMIDLKPEFRVYSEDGVITAGMKRDIVSASLTNLEIICENKAIEKDVEQLIGLAKMKLAPEY